VKWLDQVSGRRQIQLAITVTSEDPDDACERVQGRGHVRVRVVSGGRATLPELRVVLRSRFGLIRWTRGSGGHSRTVGVEVEPSGGLEDSAGEQFSEPFTVKETGIETILADVFLGHQQITNRSARARVTVVSERPPGSGGNLTPPTPAFEGSPSLFISYSRADRRWMRAFRRMLVPAQTLDLTTWSDESIVPGSDWQRRIMRELERCRGAVLLVSSNLLASDFVRDIELPYLIRAARNEQKLLFPVAISGSLAELTPLGEFQWINSPDKPLDLLLGGQRTQAIKKICAEIVGRCVPKGVGGSD
jgi:hypothetical protein